MGSPIRADLRSDFFTALKKMGLEHAPLILDGSPMGVSDEVVHQLYDLSNMVIAVDSGLELANRACVAPDVVVGDMDSVDRSLLDEYVKANVPTIQVSPVKDQTDLELALSYAKSRMFGRVFVTNFRGGRIDHELASVGIMGKCGLCVVAVDDACAMLYMDAVSEYGFTPNTARLARLGMKPGDEYSVIAFDGPARLTQTGVDYPQKHGDVDGLCGLTISNVVADETAKVTLEKGRAVLVIPFSKM